MRKESYNLIVDSKKGKQLFGRVTKTTAEKAYNAGRTVVVSAVNANLASLWSPFWVCTKTTPNSFDTELNSFIYYNCNNEMGRYPKYFIASEN